MYIVHIDIYTYLQNPSAGKKRDGPFWFKKMRWNTKKCDKIKIMR